LRPLNAEKRINSAELDDALGYSKYDDRNKATDNSRNGRRQGWSIIRVQMSLSFAGRMPE